MNEYMRHEIDGGVSACEYAVVDRPYGWDHKKPTRITFKMRGEEEKTIILSTALLGLILTGMVDKEPTHIQVVDGEF